MLVFCSLQAHSWGSWGMGVYGGYSENDTRRAGISLFQVSIFN